MQKCAAREQGLVLIAVLWIMAIVGFMVVAFASRTQTELKAGYYARLRLEAQMLAESAIEVAKAELAADDTSVDYLGERWAGGPQEDSENPFVNVPLDASSDGVYAAVGRPDEDHLAVYYGLVDECAKVNINTAAAEMLLALPGMTPEIADAIIDWRDGDSTPRTNGAESDYYSTLKVPYNCKNAPFESVDELLLVRGVTSRVLYGEDANRNGILDPNEDDGDETVPADNADGTLDVGIYRYVTVWSRTPNTDASGQARINLNGPANQLDAALTPVISDRRLRRQIVTRRQQGTFASPADLLDLGLPEDQYAQIADRLTVNAAQVVNGLINPNTAPPAVLRALPGLTENDAAGLAAFRETSPDALNSVGWVLQVVGREKFKRIANSLTTRSCQFSCEALGRFTTNRTFRRIWVVIDRLDHQRQSDRPIRIQYWQDLTGIGLAYPPPEAAAEGTTSGFKGSSSSP